MIPVVVGGAAEHAADAFGVGLAVDDHEGGEVGGGEGVEVRIDGFDDCVPRVPHFGEGRGAGGLIPADKPVKLRGGVFALRADHPVFVFLIGEMADHPTDAVDGEEAAAGFVVGEADQAALKFAAGEAELEDKRVRHDFLLLLMTPNKLLRDLP